MVFYSPLALIVREASSSCDYSFGTGSLSQCSNDEFVGAGSLSLLFSIAAMYLLMKFAFKKEFSWKQYWFAGLYALLFTPLNLAIASFLVKLIPPTPIATEHDALVGTVISALFFANILAFLLFSLKLKISSKLKK